MPRLKLTRAELDELVASYVDANLGTSGSRIAPTRIVQWLRESELQVSSERVYEALARKLGEIGRGLLHQSHRLNDMARNRRAALARQQGRGT